ncbi:cytochrome P450 [Aspergillus avenaceus]|uniref:Dihydromonacolin L monooxygenase LovA n=1 Tax=Aspergillus avenaceus TaxID=36643 RepID=A0A5N6TD86_ASPAV|nr:cytochrome P450 [Aspergillus avenaceus]
MTVILDILDSNYLFEGVVVALVLIFVSSFYRELADGLPFKGIHLVGRSRWEISNTKAKDRFVTSAKELISEGFSQGRSVFQAMFTTGPTVVLHPKYINEIKSHPDLNFKDALVKSFFGGQFPGFEPFSGHDKEQIVLEIIKKKLTHSLGQLIGPLSRATAAVLKRKLPESEEWTLVTIAQECPHIVAGVSSSIFMGDKSCLDERWLDVSVNYTTDAFFAARSLRQWPAIARPFVHWVLPSTRKIRRHVAAATQIVQEELKRRDMVRKGKLIDENPQKTHEDFLDWIDEFAAGRSLNTPMSQLSLAVASIHTTSNILTNIMYDLMAYPEHIQPLRDEIKAVVEEDGILKKTSLNKMKLMDSVMKESQRMHPVAIGTMNRLAEKEVVLSDGTRIPKGARTTLSSHILEDESIYPNAKVYDGFRFYNKRQEPGNEHRYQFVTTSPEQYVFGHGAHACPGRFFASHEIKILLIHLIMKYDWKFADRVERPPNIMHAVESICDPTVKTLYKTRQPEINVSTLEEDERMI